MSDTETLTGGKPINLGHHVSLREAEAALRGWAQLLPSMQFDPATNTWVIEGHRIGPTRSPTRDTWWLIQATPLVESLSP